MDKELVRSIFGHVQKWVKMEPNKKKDFYLATAADVVADPSAPDHMLMVSWKVKNGSGIMVFFKKEL